MTVDYGGCGWTGLASIGVSGGLPAGVTLQNGPPFVATNGIGTLDFDVVPGTVTSFDLVVTTGFITSNPGGCMPLGFNPVETIIVDCSDPPTVVATPTTLPCGQSAVTIDYGGCGWTGTATATFNHPGVTAPNGGGVAINNGAGTCLLYTSPSPRDS